MNKWFTVAVFVDEEQIRSDLYGPFDTDKDREEAINELYDENADCMNGVVRFDIEGEGVPEVVE